MASTDPQKVPGPQILPGVRTGWEKRTTLILIHHSEPIIHINGNEGSNEGQGNELEGNRNQVRK